MAKKDEEKVMPAEHVLEIRHAALGANSVWLNSVHIDCFTVPR